MSGLVQSLFFLRSRTSRRAVSAIVDVLLLVELTIYIYRDIWPLATFSLVPSDLHLGWILWARIAGISFTLMTTMLTPREYVPADPKARTRFRGPCSLLNP